VTPSATSEHNPGAARLVVSPHVLRCFLPPSLTEAPALRRCDPASSGIRTSPPPQTARPGSRELPVDRPGNHRWGFPCCLGSPMSACRRHYPGRSEGTDSLMTAPSSSAFPTLPLGRLLHYLFRGLLSVPSPYNLQTRRVALCDPLHRRLRRLGRLHRRSDCFRVQRSSSRAGLHPRCGPAPFHGAL
jgi:hypothetical protein